MKRFLIISFVFLSLGLLWILFVDLSGKRNLSYLSQHPGTGSVHEIFNELGDPHSCKEGGNFATICYYRPPLFASEILEVKYDRRNDKVISVTVYE